MSEPKFVLTRFTHGSAGKFLSTVLQTSDKIDHWSAVVQHQKKSEFIGPITLEYVRRSFPKDHSMHMQAEPMVPYNTDLYSVSHPRGNDVSLETYIQNSKLKNDLRLFACIERNIDVNLIFQKPTIPVFCQKSKAITITVTTTEEKQWLYNTLWSKHFIETDQDIRYIPNDPEYCNFQSICSVIRFGNPYRFPISSKQQLFHDYVINNHTNSWYFDPDRFAEYDHKHDIKNVFISLADILNRHQFTKVIPNIFEQLKLEEPDMDLIESMHDIWLSAQVF